MQSQRATTSRRRFLRFVAESPLLAAAGGLGGIAALRGAAAQDDSVLAGSLKRNEVIGSVDEALNVWDFEPVLRNNVNAGHYAYLAQGADDFGTMAANRRGFDKIRLRPRRLVDTTNLDMSVELFGQRYATPILLCPVGEQQMYHAEAEVAVARAAKAKNALQILSTVANFSVEDVAAARGAPGWFQLYPTSNWENTLAMVQRAERAGCTALAITVDVPSRNLEPVERFDRDNDALCQACHAAVPGQSPWRLRHMFDGLDMTGVRMGITGLTWSYLERLRAATTMSVLVKGVVTAEDAELCIQHGADGVIVSNHGGRAEESLRGTIDALPEVVAAVGGRVPVLVDSGFRRGTDIFKALALGADAVGVGRPYIWGLGAFGQSGVEKVIDILARELRIVMQQMGAVSVAQISRSSLDV
jgi:isopentenyl diphosphate isomerase/L-lactate dehydrogenase-like FMN-dependent dehydrogenase